MSQAPATDTQSRRLLIALAILLAVLVMVVAKNSDFWFGTDEAADVDSSASPSTSNSAVFSIHTQASAAQSAATQSPAQHISKTFKAPTQTVSAKAAQANATESEAPVVASHRVVLPPLDVEVVAGDKHSTVHPGSNIIVTDIPADPNRPAVLTASSIVASASQHERLSAVSAPELRQSIDATYPALGQHSRVQGSVVLEAVIGTDGVIEGLRVLSGPSILANAAQQAVRQWHFKPYLQDGRPVETKCTVTVNFSIRVADTSSNIS
ncbi:MAG TPA: energy transducer TonB [Candidatus Aquilonibacter sp.]|nr:energy transducer TonB [Candidatus Aquilonibacter sp.]